MALAGQHTWPGRGQADGCCHSNRAADTTPVSLTSVGRGHVPQARPTHRAEQLSAAHPAGQEWVSPTQSLLWVLEDWGRVHLAVVSWLPGVS